MSTIEHGPSRAHNATDWAAAIRARRAYLGKSQEQIAIDSLDSLYQGEVSRIEHGRIQPVHDLPFPKLLGLLRALEWTLHEFEQATGLEVPVYTTDQAEALEAARHLEVHPKTEEFYAYPAGRAGESEPQPIEEEMVGIPVGKLRAAGARKEHCIVYRVDSDALVSLEARRADRSVAHGDVIGVHTRAQPIPGDVVAAWWGNQSKLVLVRYELERENVVLFGDRGTEPRVLPSVDALRVLGVVFWRCG